ncbi:MAG: stage II sporulation protein P [Clostridia bacterium]|nr:stage II sporulation protein P [Clostridia bacterium]
MFNVAVVNLKDLLKYLVGIIITIIIVVGLAKYFSYAKKDSNVANKIENSIEAISQNSHVEVLNETLPGIEEITQSISETKNSEERKVSDNFYEKILQVELAEISTKEETEQNNEQLQEKQATEETQAPDNQQLQEASTDVETEIVTPEPIEANATDTYGKVQIRNQTNYTLSEQMLTPDIEVDNTNIIIFHTHTCESYTPTEQNQYEASGSYRTTDLKYSVARVGDELENYLSNYGHNVNHDKTYHDYPAYTGSYSRSLKTVEALEQVTPADIVIDLHRDAIGSNSDYAPTVKIGEDYCAQLMFVMGSDGGGLWHPNWNQNLKFAVKVQQKAEELYPGLFKPIILRNSRYNQHIAKAATIIEVGATGNTLEQCTTSMKYLSKVLNEVTK